MRHSVRRDPDRFWDVCLHPSPQITAIAWNIGGFYLGYVKITSIEDMPGRGTVVASIKKENFGARPVINTDRCV